MKILKDLIINNALELKDELKSIAKKKDPIIDLSEVKRIDVSGFQLLISQCKESLEGGKTLSIKGTFQESFVEDLDRIIFSHAPLRTGEVLFDFIKDIIRSK